MSRLLMKLEDKIKYSIELLKQHEPPEGYHLAFSGGKDSICIYRLAQMAEVKFKGYFCMTTVDPPDVLKFIKTYYPEVTFLRPKKSMFQLIEERGIPIRFKRFCCQELKEYAGKGELVVMGIRKEESKRRSTYTEIGVFRGKRQIFPILEWTERDVWAFIKQEKLMFPDVYLGCRARIGCIGCPMSPKKMAKDFELYPRFKNAYRKAIQKRMDKGKMTYFKDADEAMEWWMSGESVKVFKEKQKQTLIIFE
jgi:phosphoadenosine phosphosulfate reductase